MILYDSKVYTENAMFLPLGILGDRTLDPLVRA